MFMSFTTFSKIGLLVIAAVVAQLSMTNNAFVHDLGQSGRGEIEGAFSRIPFFADRAQEEQSLTIQAHEDAWHARQGLGSDAVLLARQGAIRAGSEAFRSLNTVHELSHQTSRLEQEVSAAMSEINAA